MFNAEEQKNKVVQWIKDWFDKNGKECEAVIGISGGKDSTVVAALCAEALGKNRVRGVIMPNDAMPDFNYAQEVINFLRIKCDHINIRASVNAVRNSIHRAKPMFTLSEQTEINLPARIRMVTLYALAQSINGRVANTCNLSEDYVGYATKYGDAAGDFAPIKSFTTDEVIQIGRELGIPEKFLIKPPSDGLCGKTDEENLGFTYAVLNRYIRTGEIDDPEVKEKIDHLHKINEFKEKVIERYEMD